MSGALLRRPPRYLNPEQRQSGQRDGDSGAGQSNSSGKLDQSLKTTVLSGQIGVMFQAANWRVLGVRPFIVRGYVRNAKCVPFINNGATLTAVPSVAE
jgi:hypothetical protein